MTDTPSIKVNGAALAGLALGALVDLDVHLSVHTAGRAELRFADVGFELFDGGEFKIGDEVEVLLPAGRSSEKSVFKGEVTAVGVEQVREQGSTPTLVVEARDWSHRLATASTFKAYLKQSPADVARDIAGRHGLTAKIEGGSTTQPYLVQTGTDHAFLTQLAREIGHEWFTDAKNLHFRPRPQTPGPTLKRSNGTLSNFSARYDGTRSPSTLKVRGWDPVEKSPVVGEAGTVLNASGADLGSTAPFVAEQYGKGKTNFGKPLEVADFGVRSDAEAIVLAKSLAKNLIGDGLTISGEAPCNPDIRAGGLVTLEDVGTKLDGDYYVTSVQHTFGPEREATTAFRSDGHAVEPAPWAPVDDGSWATRGPVIGLVTNTNDPDDKGRVKVKYPSLGDEVESDWARVASLGAGPARGFDARPEVNDEVLVAFERGDPRFPIVLGGLWNGRDALPRTGLQADGKITSRIFRSREGHELEFCDAKEADARHVTIVTGSGKTKLVLGEKGVTVESGDGDLVLKSGDAMITLKKTGDVEIKGKAVKIESSAAMNIEAAGAMTLQGTGGIKADGKAPGFEAKGTMAKLEASGILTLKGSMTKIN